MESFTKKNCMESYVQSEWKSWLIYEAHMTLSNKVKINGPMAHLIYKINVRKKKLDQLILRSISKDVCRNNEMNGLDVCSGAWMTHMSLSISPLDLSSSLEHRSIDFFVLLIKWTWPTLNRNLIGFLLNITKLKLNLFYPYLE